MIRLREGEELIKEQVTRGHPWPTVSYSQLGRACLLLGDLDGTQRLAGRLGLGRGYSRVGKPQAEHEYFTIASTMYRDMDMRFWLGETEAVMRESS